MSTTTSSQTQPSPNPHPSRPQPPPPLNLETVSHTAPLPPSAYNYESYTPSPPPSIHRWPRQKLHTHAISPARPVFLSCHLCNPVHLASILAHGGGRDVVECVAEGMTRAVLVLGGVGSCRDAEIAENAENAEIAEIAEDIENSTVIPGVLLAGLRHEALHLLESAFRRRWGETYERVVAEVRVRVEDGGEVVVPAYVYRT